MKTQIGKWICLISALVVAALWTPVASLAVEVLPIPVIYGEEPEPPPFLAAQAGVGEIGIFADQTGTDCNLSDTGPVPITYYVVHFNVDGANQVRYSAKKPACFAGSWVNDTNYFTSHSGTSQTDKIVDYGSCLSGTILVQAINYIGNGSTSCCKYPILPYSTSGMIQVRNCSNVVQAAQGWTAVINGGPTCAPCGPTPPPDTVCVYAEDFRDGDAGWVARDLWSQPPYWHWDESDPMGVMWCGDDNPFWPGGAGYGNEWFQLLSKSFTLPSGSASIAYRVQYDTEPNYDQLHLEVSTDEGTNFTELAMHDGSSGGFVTQSADLSAYAGQSVVIRFRFTSDGGWSDEDGLYPTDGAVRLDWVQVSGSETDNFATGADGWEATGRPSLPVGFRLEAQPLCEGMPCPDRCETWVAYDPDTGVFPLYHDPLLPTELAIESPVIEIPTDVTQFRLRFDVYRNLPLDNLVFYTWYVAAPPPEEGGTWRNLDFVYYGGGPGNWLTSWFDVSSLIPAGTSRIKVLLVGVDMYDVWGGKYGTGATHTAAPMFDNVAFYAFDTAAPGIDDTNWPRPCGGAPPVAADTDLDGVVDDADACPAVSSAPFDSDGDGCVDDGAGGRHVEYWARPAFPITYVINELGAPLVSDGSDFTAIQNGMAAWSGIPGSEASATYGGTTPQADANALDQVNLITFEDPDYRFGLGVLAVGLTTSFTDTTTFHGVKYRPGQIVDTDMIFNKAKSYRTLSDGPADGTLIETVATHEAGHLFGIAHSAIRSSTMFYVLSPDTSAMTLSTEDKLAFFKAYGTTAAMGAASRLTGTVKDGLTNAPVAGAAVFAINAASGDTSGCEYTLPSDGSYTFVGLPDGDYYVAIHPLNGSSTIGFLVPEYINELIADHAVRQFVAESWDAAESKNDDPASRDPVTVRAGAPPAVANFLTNVDETGPVVVSTAPEPSASGVSIGGSVLVEFSEPIESATLSGNFRLEDVPTGTFVAGNAALLRTTRFSPSFRPKDSTSRPSTV